jgi:hypothetical protein
MVTIITRVVGALLALVGLALAAVGVWFGVQLGSSGTATFAATPGSGDVIVLSPDVLNRVDADVTVTATPSSGGRVWMALANPSDATAVLGESGHLEVTGVEVGGWVLTTAGRGSGDAPDLTAAELWRNEDDAEGPVSMTVEQADAPETVVVAAQEGTVEQLTMSISDKTWFVEAVVAALVGLFLLVVGLVMLWPSRRRRRSPVDPPAPAEPAHDETTPTTTKEATP